MLLRERLLEVIGGADELHVMDFRRLAELLPVPVLSDGLHYWPHCGIVSECPVIIEKEDEALLAEDDGAVFPDDFLQSVLKLHILSSLYLFCFPGTASSNGLAGSAVRPRAPVQ